MLDRDGAGPQAPEEFWTLYDTPETAAEIAAAVYEPGTLLSNPWADVKQGSLTSRYLYTRAVDEVFARLADDQQNGQLELSWYLADRLGSVRQQVQTDGTILNEINYDSFGNIVTETNPAEGDRFKYTGREYDDLTGLYYYRARWYDAGTGKFRSEDPLEFAAGDYNLSRYTWNTPLNATDPTGLEIRLFGETWVWPWDENAAGPWETLKAYGRAAGRAAAGTAAGAASGAATGAATGAVVGGVAGASAAGVGALPGAAAGASAGAVSGAVWGGITGFIAAATADSAQEAARNGAKGGAVSGAFGGALRAWQVCRAAQTAATRAGALLVDGISCRT